MIGLERVGLVMKKNVNIIEINMGFIESQIEVN